MTGCLPRVRVFPIRCAVQDKHGRQEHWSAMLSKWTVLLCQFCCLTTPDTVRFFYLAWNTMSSRYLYYCFPALCACCQCEVRGYQVCWQSSRSCVCLLCDCFMIWLHCTPLHDVVWQHPLYLTLFGYRLSRQSSSLSKNQL